MVGMGGISMSVFQLHVNMPNDLADLCGNFEQLEVLDCCSECALNFACLCGRECVSVSYHLAASVCMCVYVDPLNIKPTPQPKYDLEHV